MPPRLSSFLSQVGSKEPVHVHVALQTRKDDGQLEAPETLLFPRQGRKSKV